MRTCVKRYLHRSRVIEQLIEDWKSQQDHGKSRTFLTAVIPECIDVGALSQQVWEYALELLRTDPNGDEIESVGKIMKPELPKTLAAFSWIQEMMAGVNSTGAMITDSATFGAAAKQIREVSAKIEMVFPELNKEMAEASLAEIERGEYQTIEDLIREIQGHSAPTH